MKRILPAAARLAVAACAIAAAHTSAVRAETLVVDGAVTVRESSVERPARGTSMKTVEERFGAPAARQGTVGEPPITRWDYPGFSVFFERDLVIHAVATQR